MYVGGGKGYSIANHCATPYSIHAALRASNMKVGLCFHQQIAETYAFLPREAVTRFLMSCGECQKRMHITNNGQESKGNAEGVLNLAMSKVFLQVDVLIMMIS